MRHASLLLLALLALGCTPTIEMVHWPPPRTALAQPSPMGVLRLAGREEGLALAHGCPVGERTIYSVAHMTSEQPVIWSDLGGNSGTAWFRGRDPRRDLVRLESEEALPLVYKVAESQPIVGTRVSTVGFWYSQERFLQQRRFVGQVLTTISGYLFFDVPLRGETTEEALPGTSGSCVFNEAGEVVAITIGGGGRTKAAFGAAVWGPWQKFEVVDPATAEESSEKGEQ